jgi:hypothetical protein
LILPAGTSDFSYEDRSGTVYYKYLLNIPSADVQGYVSAFTTRHAGYNIGGVPPRLNPDKTYSLILTAAPQGASSMSNADYDNVGEWRYGFFGRNGKEYRVVVLYTRDKVVAQNYALGIDATKTYGQITDLNISSAAFGDYGGTTWTSSRVVDAGGQFSSGVDRNRGNGRYIAVRVQEKVS